MKKKRRKRHSAKWDRCVRKVRRASSAVNPYAVCTRSVNPAAGRGFRTVLYARAPDQSVLCYVGGIKFSRKGTPVRFANRSHAMTIAKQLWEQFPVLKTYRIWAE